MIRSLDASDPDSLLRVGGYIQHQAVNALRVSDGHGYLAAKENGFQVLKLDSREPPPLQLRIRRRPPNFSFDAGTLDLSLPSSPGAWELQAALSLRPPVRWERVVSWTIELGTESDGELHVSLHRGDPSQRFFRLIKR